VYEVLNLEQYRRAAARMRLALRRRETEGSGLDVLEQLVTGTLLNKEMSA